MTSDPTQPSTSLEQLRQALEAAQTVFAKDNQSQKHGVQLALEATISFLHEQFPGMEGDRLALPLLRLLSGIRNPHTGLVQDIIKQAGKRPGGSALASDEDGFRAFAAMAAEILTQSALMPPPQANTYVARSLTKSGWTKKRKTQGSAAQIDAATVEGWRQTYRSNSRDTPAFINTLADTRTADLNPADAKTMADLILNEFLPTYYGHMRTPTQ